MSIFVLGLSLSVISFYLSNFLEYLSHVVCSILSLTLCKPNTCYIDLVAMFITF